MKKNKKEDQKKIGIFIVPTEEGTTVKSCVPVSVSFVNKINNSANENKIQAHLKDMRCQHCILDGDNGPMSVLSQTFVDEISSEQMETLIKVMSANHDSFIENVERRMEEPKPENQDLTPGDQTETRDESIKYAAELLKDLECFDNNDDLIIADTYGFVGIPVGQIKAGFLKEMIDAFIDKKLLDNG